MNQSLSPRALRGLLAAGIAAFLFSAGPSSAIVPFGTTPPAVVGGSYDYKNYLFIKDGECQNGRSAELSLANFPCTGNYKFTDYREPMGLSPSYDPAVANNPQELFGVQGAATNRAWEVSTGRPDIVISVMDSGIKWQESLPNLVNKIYLNRRELPMPQGGPNPADTRFDGYDVNGDGVFNVKDYANDKRVYDFNGNGQIDPQDLIHIFSNGIDEDNNGYVDDIAGWDFFENDNDPEDEVVYGHGTGEAEDSSAEVPGDNGAQCPNCMVMPLRVGDSFVADVNHFAEAVVYSVDNGVSVIQEAEGDINHTSFAQQALDYAYAHGVIVNASEADENASHHMWPAAYDKTMVVNSVRPANTAPAARPYSYLYFNACTNFGAYTYVSIPSSSCSSEATGRSSGISGLAQAAARNAVDLGKMSRYLDANGSPALWALSAEELRQLWRLGADDIDFSSPCPGPHAGCNKAPAGVTASAAPNNYATTIPGAERYHTIQGWDYFTGYGRANNGRMLRLIGRQGVAGSTDKIEGPATLTAQDRIPPEAYIESPRWWKQYAARSDNSLLIPDDPILPDQMVVKGHAAANRVTAAGGSFDYVLEWAPQIQGPDYVLAASSYSPASGSEDKSGGPWTTINRVNGLKKAVDGELGRASIAAIRTVQAASRNPFTPASDPVSPYAAEKDGIRLRLRVIAHPVNAADTINNEAVSQKQVDVYAAVETIMRDDLGTRGQASDGGGSPSFHDIDGDGKDELILFTGDGLVHAYTDVAQGRELRGWPVHSLPLSTPGLHGAGSNADIPLQGNNAYTRGDVASDFYSPFLLGAPVVADLDDDGTVEVLAADNEGHVYAWEPDGSMRPGFPVTVDYSLSTETPCRADTIPLCDDYAPKKKRSVFNRRSWGFISNPAVGNLDPAYPGLEIIGGASDGHLYVWHADGTPMNGWPVILRDPSKVLTMDPETRFMTYKADSGVRYGMKILRTPALTDLDGDGKLDVVVGTNEEYTEPPNAGLDPTLAALNASGVIAPGNARLYALWNDGAAHAQTAASNATVHRQDQAYKPGWPIKLAMITTQLLPTVGSGVNTQPVIFKSATGAPQIAVSSAAGPGYVFNADGTSAFGSDQNGAAVTLASSGFGAGSTATDTPSYIGVGGMAVGSLDNGVHMTVIGPGAGLKRLLSIAAIDEHSLGAEDHLALWDARTGRYEQNAPIIVNDLQFLNPPIVADLTGDGLAEAVQSTAIGDTVVVGLASTSNTATRYHTGGWIVNSAAVGGGPISGPDAGKLHLATMTREGYLRLYATPVLMNTAAGCTSLAQWPEISHDAHRTGDFSHDGERPYAPHQFAATVTGTAATLSFKAPGDDRDCGLAMRYEVRIQDEFVAADWKNARAPSPAATLPTPLASGTAQTATLSGLAEGRYTVLMRAYDKAGNGSAIAKAFITVGNPPPLAPPFTFIERSNVPVNTFVTSETVTVNGFTGLAGISIGNGGQYSINGAAFTNVAGQIAAGSKLVVRHVSADTVATSKISVVTVGTYTTPFKSTTTADDRVPNAFSFGSRSGLVPGTLVESDAVKLDGFNVAISIVAGPNVEYRIGSGDWTRANGTLTPTPGTMTASQTLQVRHTSNSAHLGYTKTYLKVGGVTGYFTTRTQ